MSPVQSVDAAIIGCGVIGASIAWRLSNDRMTVACFDPEPGGGSTHAAAGMLAPVSEASFGEHDLTRMNVEAARGWPAFVAELESESGRSTGFRRSGTLTVAYDTGDRRQLSRLLDLRRQWGLEVEEVTADTARGMEPLLGPRIAGALWAGGDHQVDPRRAQEALLAAIRHRGVSIVGERVASLTRAPDGRVTGLVDASGHEYSAGCVVVAAGWSSRDVLDMTGVAAPTRPVKGQVLRLDAGSRPEFALAHIVRGHVQGRPVYLVPRESGEVVVGATDEEQPDDRRMTAGGVFGVLRDARALVPGIDELTLTDVTARARPGSPDNVPMVGPSGVDGLVLATGHHRNGVLLAPVTAEVIAACVRDGAVPDGFAAADPRRYLTSPTAMTGGSR